MIECMTRKAADGQRSSTKIAQRLGVAMLALICLSLPACSQVNGQPVEEHSSIVVTNAGVKDVTITQQYVCLIHSKQHISIRALEGGYLQEIRVGEGDSVKKDELLFQIVPTLYQARLNAELAEAELANLEFKNTNRLLDNHVVS